MAKNSNIFETMSSDMQAGSNVTDSVTEGQECPIVADKGKIGEHPREGGSMDSGPVANSNGRDASIGAGSEQSMALMMTKMLELQEMQVKTLSNLQSEFLPVGTKRKMAGPGPGDSAGSVCTAGQSRSSSPGTPASSADGRTHDSGRGKRLKRDKQPGQTEAAGSNKAQDGRAHDSGANSDESDDGFEGLLQDGDAAEESDSVDDTLDTYMDDFQASFEVGEKTGPKINDKLAATVNTALRAKMSAEARGKVMDAYDRPSNMDNLTVPRVNTELWSVVKGKQAIRARELNLAKMQRSLTKAMTAILKTTDALMDAKARKTPVDVNSVMKFSTDSLRIMSGLYGDFNVTRRQNIKPIMKDQFRSLCGSDNPVTDKLFGDDVGKKMKDLKDSKNVEISWKEDRYYSNGHTRRQGHYSQYRGRGGYSQNQNQFGQRHQGGYQGGYNWNKGKQPQTTQKREWHKGRGK